MSLTPSYDRDWREYEVEDDLGEFPVGWEQRTTPSGVVYFVDHIHRTTTVCSTYDQLQYFILKCVLSLRLSLRGDK